MLSRLWRWAVPKQETKPADVTSRAPSVAVLQQASTSSHEGVVANSNASVEPSFFDELAREQPVTSPVSTEHEAQIERLVLAVVDYVRQKKLDPPVVPALVPRVLAIVAEPEVDLQRLTHVIQQDLAISAKLLSVANSPLFGAGAEVKTVRQAIAQLGTEQVAQVAIGLACRSSLEGESALDAAFAARWQRLFQHGMTCAFAAAQMAGKGDRAAQESAFLGGLFHDVGKAVALRAIEALLEKGELTELEGPSRELVIEEALQRIHAYPGNEFYEKWTLPDALMQLCAGHHQLDDVSDPGRTFHLVALISSLDSLLRGDAAERRDALAEARVCASKLGLTDASLRGAYNDTRVIGDRTTRMFHG